MNKNWTTRKIGIWYHFGKVLSTMVLIQAFLLCLSITTYAEKNSSENPDFKKRTEKTNPVSLNDRNEGSVNFQQEKTIKGKVTDASTGESIPGANISIEGTSSGTVTNASGEYTLTVPNDNTVLLFSFVGYTTERVVIGSNTTLNVELKQNTTELEETVVIGYQQVHKKRVTASVVSVHSDVIAEIPAASLSTLLSGKVAGVQNLSRTGAPGAAGGGLLIRGNTHVSPDLDMVNGLSSPLYVIDGIPTSLEDLAGYDVTHTDYLSSLNPADIESIDILKDASAAAIYGSRGANGVIIIKTKKGRVGEPEFRLNTYFGVSTRPDLYTVFTGAADRRFKLSLLEKDIPKYTEWGPYSEGKARLMPIELTDSLNPAFNNNYDFQGMFYRKGYVNNYDFNVTGGTNATNYRIGLGYYNEKGIITANDYSRYTFNANIRNRFSSKVLNDLTVRTSFIDRQTGLGDSDPAKTFPIEPINLPASYLYKSQEELDALVGKFNKVYNTNRVIETQISNLLQIDFFKGFKLFSQVGLSFYQSKKNFFGPSVIHENEQSYGFSDQSIKYSAMVETYATYDKTIGENHRFNFLAGHGVNYNQNEIINLLGEDGSSDGIKTIVGYKKENIWGYSNVTSNSMLSYWVKAAYSFKNRYMIDIAYRREASSRFGIDKRWGDFPSIGTGWEISDESFWKPLSKIITYAKIRSSYGINGSQFANDYLRFNEYTTADIYMWNPHMDVKTYGGTTAISPDFNKIANNNLSWEETRQWNIAADLTGFTNRLYMTIEAYHKYTNGKVFPINFPSYSGYSSASANLVDVVNQGWEFILDGHVFPRDNDFQWELILNLSHNENYIAALPYNGRDFLNKDKDYAYVLGFPVNVPWMYEYLGVIQDVKDLPVNPFTGEILRNQHSYKYSDGGYFPGMSLIRDLNGDYIIMSQDDSDFAFITDKTANPKITGGFNTVIKYKKWMLRANSYFAFGHYIFNQTMFARLDRYSTTPNYGPWLPKASYELPDEFWQKPGDETTYPEFMVGIFDGGTSGNFSRSSLFLEKGDYWKISDITLSYTFDESMVKKMKLGDIRVYSTVYNLYQWQKASVPDASMIDAMGNDYGNGYPQSKKFIFGVNIKF